MRSWIKIEDAANWDHVVVMTSGGKDSSVLMQYAAENFRPDQITCVHAVIDIDHKETLGVVRSQAAFFQMPLVEVQAVNARGENNGFIKMMLQPRINRKTGKTGQQLFPDCSTQNCTRTLKISPCDKFIRTLKGNVLVLIGERHEESVKRSKLEAWRPDEDLSLKDGSRTVVKFSPLLPMKELEVWDIIRENQIPVHPCYSQGFSRASCAICIHSKDTEVALAAKHQTPIVARYIWMERQLNHSYRYKAATKKKPAQRITVEMILKDQGAFHLVESELSKLYT